MSAIVPIEVITGKIYFIRRQKVMLDSDLAKLYGVSPKRLNEQVKRNIERFPEDFMFQLNSKEIESLRSHFATLKRGQHRKYLPYAFTEHGVAMLSSVLRSKQAIEVNIAIIRAFIRLREYIALNRGLSERVNKIERKLSIHDENFIKISEYMRLMNNKQRVKDKKYGYK